MIWRWPFTVETRCRNVTWLYTLYHWTVCYILNIGFVWRSTGRKKKSSILEYLLWRGRPFCSIFPFCILIFSTWWCSKEWPKHVVGSDKLNVQTFRCRDCVEYTVRKFPTLSYVYWAVPHCDSWRIKDQLDVTCYFISLLMCSTCFGH